MLVPRQNTFSHAPCARSFARAGPHPAPFAPGTLRTQARGQRTPHRASSSAMGVRDAALTRITAQSKRPLSDDDSDDDIVDLTADAPPCLPVHAPPTADKKAKLEGAGAAVPVAVPAAGSRGPAKAPKPEPNVGGAHRRRRPRPRPRRAAPRAPAPEQRFVLVHQWCRACVRAHVARVSS
jgi:hypothetical protein